jgi:ribosome-associated protein
VALDKKATQVLILDTREHSSSVGYDYVVLATGESDRQIAAIAEGVDAVLKPQGKRASSVEASPDWVCVVYDDGVMAHFLTPDAREARDIEGMWKDAPREPHAADD